MLAARVVAHAHACACAHARQLACTMSSHARAGNKEGANTEVVIAMGSNMGDRAHYLWRALQQMPGHGIKVVRTSLLYETAPAYVTDQPAFLNAALLATTTLAPRELLRALKEMEAGAGRDLQGGARWGPRPLDLDLVAYGAGGYSDPHLQVPHPRWQEREFVTLPMADLWYPPLAPPSPSSLGECCHSQGTDVEDPQRSVAGLLRHASQLAAPHAQRLLGASGCRGRAGSGGEKKGEGAAGAGSTQGGPPGDSSSTCITTTTQGGDVLRRVTPCGREGRGHLITWGAKTYIMGILNITPDSFSDGGRFVAGAGCSAHGSHGRADSVPHAGGLPDIDVSQAVAVARQMAEQGADIIDVGGQSTRPGSERLSAELEAARAVPVIRALATDPQLLAAGTLISVDTYQAAVARLAVEAGAHIVNDVAGGTLDPLMFETVSELGVPYVLMHMRGDPNTMQSTQHTTYSQGVVRGVAQELTHTAHKAMRAGIPAWNIITDPGVGFPKTPADNLALIRELPALRDEARGGLSAALARAPVLVGPSRKGFLGNLIGRPGHNAKERDAATLAACVACVGGGADIVRVHAVRQARDAMVVADALYRGAQAG